MEIRDSIGFGCVGLSAQPFEANALRLLEVAYNEGIMHFDTAPLYGKGYSEKILGNFIKGKRNQVTITTKFGISVDGTKNIPTSLALPLNYLKKIKAGKQQPIKLPFQALDLLSYRKVNMISVRDGFEKSLRNLKTDYIDFYLLHEALPDFLTDEALQYILDLKQKGFVKRIGIAASYNNIEKIQPATINNWDVLQYENSLLHPSESLLNSFADKKHFYHSILKPMAYNKINISLKDIIPGLLLARAFKINKGGKILFSTSKDVNIKKNMQTLDIYNQYPIEELNKIIANAIH